MISFTVPIQTVSALNVREHHMVKAKRVKRERRATALKFTAAIFDFARHAQTGRRSWTPTRSLRA